MATECLESESTCGDSELAEWVSIKVCFFVRCVPDAVFWRIREVETAGVSDAYVIVFKSWDYGGYVISDAVVVFSHPAPFYCVRVTDSGFSDTSDDHRL